MIPGTYNIRRIGKQLVDKGLFINTIEESSVPKGKERFRISVMATHTDEDLKYLADCFGGSFERKYR